MENKTLVVIRFHLSMVVYVLVALFLLRKAKRVYVALPTYLIAIGMLGFVSTLLTPVDGFYQIQLLAWVVFLYILCFLLGGAYLLYKQNRKLVLGNIALAGLILVVCADAFLIEPHWLQVTRIVLSDAKLRTSVRVAIVTDLQTDVIGNYEERVLRMVKTESPDLILFGGDYLHLGDGEQYTAMSGTLNEMLRETGLDAPLGIYAVRGNVDWVNEWQKSFVDLPIQVFNKSMTLDLGPLVLTGLTLEDSFNTELQIGAQEKYHIVLGHTPDFSLGQVDADLLVAGHTHGGQVQIPFVGPILTLTRVPRSWASGMTVIEPEKVLIVSRGIGMERGNAPRMRFLCRPELIILDIEPSK
jgi:predicted MPP superfamily phosphohydrolase